MPKTKKKTKKKNKKTVKRKPPRPIGLHAKKIQIMNEIPIMPVSAIGKDRQGARYCHTQAEKVYAMYRKACSTRNLTIRRVNGQSGTANYQDNYQDKDGMWVIQKTICSTYEGIWEIRDAETGQTEQFAGAGYGDNYVWSCNSAQTVARKQALLDYFEVPWPQPDQTYFVVKDGLSTLDAPKFVDAVKAMMPDDTKLTEIKEQGGMAALIEFFSQF